MIVGFDSWDLIRSWESRINTDSISSRDELQRATVGTQKASKIDSFVRLRVVCVCLSQKSDQAKECMPGMPGYTEARKAVVSCDKPGGAAHKL